MKITVKKNRGSLKIWLMPILILGLAAAGAVVPGCVWTDADQAAFEEEMNK